MTFPQEKELFENNKNVYSSSLLKFNGIHKKYDVYNCSIPFRMNGKTYIYGRVEERDIWANSIVMLFERTDTDTFTLVKNTMMYQLEDPFIAKINGELIFGGTHVRKRQGEIDTYYAYFYRGTDIDNMTYFTTGPDYMKDIRLVQLKDDKVGVFSRPRSEEIRKKYGSESVIGFTVIDNIDRLNDKVVENAKPIEGLFAADEWGGCNQAYFLDSGYIGVIAHKCYKDSEGLLVYTNTAFVFDPAKHKVIDHKIIGTRSCYPKAPSKVPNLADCVFSSGIVIRNNSRVDLYSGVGDTYCGRLVIDYPFEGFGNIVEF
ncbi:MAG: DUF1861 family protein [Eubacteriales bacterium]|nr:DUF1861 family protein [Eubacteriales bacterium]